MNSVKKFLLLVLVVSAGLIMISCGGNSVPDNSGSVPESKASANSNESAAASNPVEHSGPKIIKDLVGRDVELPAKIDSIIALGSGAPRLVAYLDAMDMIVGAEEYIRDGVNIRRDYNPVHHAYLLDLPLVGQGGGGGQNNAYPEEIIMLNPDLIIAGFDLEAANELQTQTNIPVVSVRHDTGLAPESLYQSLELLGDILGKEDRATYIMTYMDEMLADLQGRTVGIADADKPTAYAGAVTWNGRRGFSGTYSVFGIFDAINAINAAAAEGIAGFYETDLEQVMVWDPDVIFLDPGNMDLVNEEYKVKPDFFNALSAVKEGRVYSMPAFNNAGTNFTYAFIDAYYAGKVLYPDQFADIEISEKAGEILTNFLGENIYDLMANGGLIYGPITIGK